MKKGFTADLEAETRKNTNFRKVLYTGKYSQLVLMCLKPGEEIGEETHDDVDQFFRFEEGGRCRDRWREEPRERPEWSGRSEWGKT